MSTLDLTVLRYAPVVTTGGLSGPAAKRRTVVDATLRIIADDGVEAATTRRIAAEAGVAQSGLFYSFGSRDGLLAEVVEAGIDAEIASFDQLLNRLEASPPTPNSDVAQLLRQGFGVYLDALAADPAKERALISLGLYAQRTAGIEHLAKRLYQGYYDLVARLLAAVARHAGFAWARSPGELAPIVVAFSDGLTMAYLADPGRDLGPMVEGAVTLLSGYVTDRVESLPGT